MNDFCTACSTCLADAAICPFCGTDRPVVEMGDDTEPQAAGSFTFPGDLQPGAVLAQDQLAAALVLQHAASGRRFGRIAAINPATLTEAWCIDLPDDLINTPLQTWDDTILFSTQTADPLRAAASLHAVGVAGGQERWRWEPNMRALSAPALVGDRLWVMGDGNRLFVLDAANGKVLDSAAFEFPRHILPPACHQQLLLIPQRQAAVLAVDLQTLDVVWEYRHQPTGEVEIWSGTPLGMGERVAIPFTDGGVAVVGAHDGALCWALPGEERFLPPLLSDGVRLFVGRRRGLVALNVQTGEELWQMPSERRVTAAPLLARNTLIVAGHDHSVRGLDPRTGEERWRWQGDRRFESSPVLTPQGLALFDSGDTLTLLHIPRPLFSTAAALEAGDWRGAASALAAAGQMQAAADLLTTHNDFLAAAELWAQLGDLVQAAALYEKADTETGWQKAARLYEQSGDFVARAVAWQRVAELRDDAASWESTWQAYREAGMQKEAAASWREVCRLRRYPFMLIEARAEAGFVQGQYNVLGLVLRNVGEGVAALLSARATGPFKGADMQSQMVGNLAPNRTAELQLGLAPESAGALPLTLEVSFRLGPRGESHAITQRLFVQVASHEAQRQPSSDLVDQINASFDVVDRASFRRSTTEIEMARLREKLAILQDQRARLDLRKTEMGVLAPVELDTMIARKDEEIAQVRTQLETLLSENPVSPAGS